MAHEELHAASCGRFSGMPRKMGAVAGSALTTISLFWGEALWHAHG